MNQRWLCALTLALVGCASGPPMGRDKPGASTQEFMADRYTCLQQSQSPAAGSFVGPYGGSSAAQIVCDYQMYDACMSAKGYLVVPNGRFQAQVLCRR